MTRPIFTVDLGATWLRTAVVSPADLQLSAKAIAPTPSTTADARALIEAEWRRTGALPAVAIAAAPELTPAGLVRRWPNRRDYEGANLLSEAIGAATATAIFDDATAAAISAHAFERQGDRATTLCLTIGTGIGGGAVVAGVPLTGRSGAAMDAGHMVVPAASGLLCTCGRRGCLQAAASATGIRDQLALPRPVRDIFQEKGPDVAAALQRAVTAITEALAIINCLFDPDRVLLAGGFGLSKLFDHVENALKQCQMSVTIERHPRGEDAGLVGAAIGFGLRHGHEPKTRQV